MAQLEMDVPLEMLFSTPQKRWRGLGRARRLGQVPSDFGIYGGWDPSVAPSSTPQAPALDAADCSWWDFFFNVPAWNACTSAAIASGPASVVANAQQYYGVNSVPAQAAAQAAAAQAALAPSDAAAISQYYGAGQLIYNPQNPSSPGGLPSWFWWVVGGVAGLVALKTVAS